MEPKVKKGLIIGGSILGVVLILSGVGLGLYFGLNGKKGVDVWGYDDQVSSTGKKINYYMNADFTEASDIYGDGTVLSAEPNLLNNKHYHSVQDDIDILDGVKGSKDGLGYLSSTWVSGTSGYEDAFSMLKLFKADKDWANATTENYKNVDNYLDPADPTVNGDKAEYVTVDPAEEYESLMASTLNIHMKVPATIADAIRPYIQDGTTTDIELDDEYKKWLIDKKFADEFVLAMGFMRYIATDNKAVQDMTLMALEGTNSTGTGDWGAADITALDTIYKSIMGTDADFVNDLTAQQSETVYSIKVDGTGTNSGAMNVLIDDFQDAFNTSAGSDLKFNYSLTNGGSGEGWKVPNGQGNVPLTEAGSKPTDANVDAFLGTQSRATKFAAVDSETGEPSGEALSWGYTADKEGGTLSFDDSVEKYKTYSEQEDGQIIGYTMAVDLPVFFVNEGMTAEYTVEDEGSLAMIENASEKGIKVGDTINVTPTGITPDGAKDLYQNGAQWSDVLDDEEILAIAV